MKGPSSKKLVFLYFSGTGGTRLVAELLGELVSEKFECSAVSIEDDRARLAASDSDLIVLLYPTYYLKPAPSMLEFAENLGPFGRPKTAYLVTTYELYAENSIRRLAQVLKRRGCVVAGSARVRAPGSDVTAALPGFLIPWWYRFEKKLPDKLRRIAVELTSIAQAGTTRESIPRLKWYTPFSQLLQILFFNRFDLFKRHFRVLRDRCTRCGACVGMCSRKAWSMGGEGPVHDYGRCELCCRCIHRCPKGAIVILKAFRNNRRLDEAFFARLGAEARSRLRTSVPDRSGPA
jgi:ferredoxin/flavodoxin